MNGLIDEENPDPGPASVDRFEGEGDQLVARDGSVFSVAPSIATNAESLA